MRQVFVKLDADGSGFLTKEEILDALKSEFELKLKASKIADLLCYWCKDADKKINYEEFVQDILVEVTIMKLQILVVLYLTNLHCWTGVDGANDTLFLDGVDDKTTTNLQSRSSEAYKLPYVREIRFPMYSGKVISIEGNTSGSATDFSARLCRTDSCGSEVPLGLRFDFKENKLIRSSSNASAINCEENYGSLPIKSGTEFKLDIIITDSMFKIVVNGEVFVTYPNQMPIAYIKYIHVSGQVVVNWILYSVNEPTSPVKIEKQPSGEKIVIYGYRNANATQYNTFLNS
ncbi:uncharacterized protein LOC131945429 [Physella acuta]|uniref:uncharacterized protein LOC131945429 n=1 Tax=Physella acuta TaxID=109671 RepID=UPI0027DE56AA|nr:uncharacterized protein LOC131945429 [Physella acuta]